MWVPHFALLVYRLRQQVRSMLNMVLRSIVVADLRTTGEWATTEPSVTYEQWSETHVRREVDVAKIGDIARAQLGKSFDLYAQLDRKCTGTLGQPFLFADASAMDEMLPMSAPSTSLVFCTFHTPAV